MSPSIAREYVFCETFLEETCDRSPPGVGVSQWWEWSNKRMQREFVIDTQGPGLYEFTSDVRRALVGCGDGILTLMIRHTSASLLIQENADPDVKTDLQGFFNRLVPPADDPSMAYLRHTLEGPDDMPAHIKAAILPVSLTIPVRAGQPELGTWQGIYLVEHRARPHRRRVAAQFLSGA